MGVKVIVLSAILILVGFADSSDLKRERRSAMRELQTSLLDIIHGGNVKSRIWKRAIPQAIKKTTKSNEAIPEFTTRQPPLCNAQPNTAINSEELYEPDPDPLTLGIEGSSETPSKGTRTPPNNRETNSGIKSPQNREFKPKNSLLPTPITEPLFDPNSTLNSDETKHPNAEEFPAFSASNTEEPNEVITTKPNIKSQKPIKIPSKPQKTDSKWEKDQSESGEPEKPEEPEEYEEPEESEEFEKPEEYEEPKEPEESEESEEPEEYEEPKEPEEPEENEELEEHEETGEPEVPESPEESLENGPQENTRVDHKPGNIKAGRNSAVVEKDKRKPKERVKNIFKKPMTNADTLEENSENVENSKMPSQNGNNKIKKTGYSNDSKEPKESVEESDEPEDDGDKPRELSENPDDETPSQPKLPIDFKRNQRPSSTLKPRHLKTRPTKPPPPFPGDQSLANAKKPRTDSPITYINPFKSSTKAPQSTSIENTESSENPINEDNDVNKKPIPTNTQASKRRLGTKQPSKTLTRPRNNITSSKAPKLHKNPIDDPLSTDNEKSISEIEPKSDDDETNEDQNAEDTSDDSFHEISDPIITTSTTSKPRTNLKERSKNATKHPTKRPKTTKSLPINPIETEDPDTITSDINPNLTLRFRGIESDTQSLENPMADTPKFPLKSPNHSYNQIPNPTPVPSNPFPNNPFLSSPFDFGTDDSFSSARSNANVGASASASSSAFFNAGAPWPNFFQNYFANTPMVPPPMFANNPFFKMMNNPNDQQTPNSPPRSSFFNNSYDPSKNRPIRGDSKLSSSQSEPSGYTPVISISGSFDTNNPLMLSRSSFSPSDTLSGSNDNDDINFQANFNAPSHGPRADVIFNPMFGQISNSNSYSENSSPSDAGVDSSSFSSTGGSGSQFQSTSDNRYPRSDEFRRFPVDDEASLLWPAIPSVGDIMKHNLDMQTQIQNNIAAMHSKMIENMPTADSADVISSSGISSASSSGPSGASNMGMTMASSNMNSMGGGSGGSSTSMSSVTKMENGKMVTRRIMTVTGIDENGKRYQKIYEMN